MSIKKIQEFTENASPDNWLHYGDEFKRAALALWKDKGNLWIDFSSDAKEGKERPAISRSFMLVSDFSIENVLKAYLVAINPALINTGVLDKKLHEHNLVKLSNLCTDLSFDNKEIELMEILSAAIPYWGRYPIPIRYNNIKPEKIVSEEFYDVYKVIYDKIFNAVLDKIKNGWDAGNGVSFEALQYRNFDKEEP